MKQALVLCCCMLLAACAKPTPPFVLDENQAIAAANAFLKNVIRGDYTAAYDYISPGAKFTTQMRFEQFSADLDALKGKYGPIQKAVLDGYQPVPGRRVVQLYYKVFHTVPAPIVYHLLVEANPSGKYTVYMIDVGNAMLYPPNAAATVVPLKKPETIEVTGK